MQRVSSTEQLTAASSRRGRSLAVATNARRGEPGPDAQFPQGPRGPVGPCLLTGDARGAGGIEFTPGRRK